MKRIIALTLAILMVVALLCACGDKTKDGDKQAAAIVTATVDKAYDTGFAEKYAKSVTTDSNGNKVYEFDDEAYENYTHDYNNSVSSEITGELAQAHDTSYGQFSYIDDERSAVVVGLNPGQYDEAVASQEAQSLAEKAFPYFQGLKTPVNTVNVIYCNANNQSEVYGTFAINI